MTVRPMSVVNLESEHYERLAAARAAGTHGREFETAWQNGRVFARAEHPLVLFMDDLQWADSPSLKLMQVLLTDPDLGRLLIIGAVAVVRWAARKGAPVGSWLARMMERKPRMLVAVALANRMARIAWALR